MLLHKISPHYTIHTTYKTRTSFNNSSTAHFSNSRVTSKVTDDNAFHFQSQAPAPCHYSLESPAPEHPHCNLTGCIIIMLSFSFYSAWLYRLFPQKMIIRLSASINNFRNCELTWICFILSKFWWKGLMTCLIKLLISLWLRNQIGWGFRWDADN